MNLSTLDYVNIIIGYLLPPVIAWITLRWAATSWQRSVSAISVELVVATAVAFASGMIDGRPLGQDWGRTALAIVATSMVSYYARWKGTVAEIRGEKPAILVGVSDLKWGTQQLPLATINRPPVTTSAAGDKPGSVVVLGDGPTKPGPMPVPINPPPPVDLPTTVESSGSAVTVSPTLAPSDIDRLMAMLQAMKASPPSQQGGGV